MKHLFWLIALMLTGFPGRAATYVFPAATNANNTFFGTNVFKNPRSIIGDGLGLTNLNASVLASGTVPDARLSTNVLSYCPFKAPTTFTVVGDSLSDDGGDWPGWLFRGNYGWLGNYYNNLGLQVMAAHAGSGLFALDGLYATEVLPYAPTNGTNSVLFLFAGANMEATNAVAWCNCWSNYVWRATNDGFKVCAFTIPPSYVQAGTTNWFVGNNYIRSSPLPSWVVDVAANFPNFADTNVFETDQIHLNINGSRLLAMEVAHTLMQGQHVFLPPPRNFNQAGTNFYAQSPSGQVLAELDGLGKLSADGAGLSNLNGSAISTGTVDNARLPANVLTNGAVFTGLGGGLSNLNGANLQAASVTSNSLDAATWQLATQRVALAAGANVTLTTNADRTLYTVSASATSTNGSGGLTNDASVTNLSIYFGETNLFGSNQFWQAMAAPNQSMQNVVGRRPIKGFMWNAVKCQQCALDTADYMKTTGLVDAGYDMILIDCYFGAARDASGYLTVNSAIYTNGFPWLASVLATNGIRLGLYLVVGASTNAQCVCSTGQADTDLSTVDKDVYFLLTNKAQYVWVDWSDANPAIFTKDIAWAVAAKLQESVSRQSIALGLPAIWLHHSIGSQWTAVGPWVSQAQSFRFGWGGAHGGDGQHDWWPNMLDWTLPSSQIAGPGHYVHAHEIQWANPWIEGTACENGFRAFFSMLCMASSTLIIGPESRTAPSWALNCLTNRDLLDLDNDPLGKPCYPVSTNAAGIRTYFKPLVNGDVAVALWNPSGTNSGSVTLNLRDVHELQCPDSCGVLDILDHIVTGITNSLTVSLATNSLNLYRLSRTKPGISLAAFPILPYDTVDINAGIVTRLEHWAWDYHASNFCVAAGIAVDPLVHRSAAVNHLAQNAKTHGWWDICDGIYPFSGTSSNSQSWNLKATNAFNWTWAGTGNTFTTNGYTGDGNGWGVGPNPHALSIGSGTNYHLFVWSGTTNHQPEKAYAGCAVGSDTANGTFGLFASYNDVRGYVGGDRGTGGRIRTPDLGTILYDGPIIVSACGVETNQAWVARGAYIGTRADPITFLAIPNTNIFLLNIAIGGSSSYGRAGNIKAATVGGYISEAQWPQFQADWQAYLDEVNLPDPVAVPIPASLLPPSLVYSNSTLNAALLSGLAPTGTVATIPAAADGWLLGTSNGVRRWTRDGGMMTNVAFAATSGSATNATNIYNPKLTTPTNGPTDAYVLTATSTGGATAWKVGAATPAANPATNWYGLNMMEARGSDLNYKTPVQMTDIFNGQTYGYFGYKWIGGSYAGANWNVPQTVSCAGTNVSIALCIVTTNNANIKLWMRMSYINLTTPTSSGYTQTIADFAGGAGVTNATWFTNVPLSYPSTNCLVGFCLGYADGPTETAYFVNAKVRFY